MLAHPTSNDNFGMNCWCGRRRGNKKREKPKWRWLDVHAMHIADVAQERRKNAKMTVSVCSRYALCVIVKCFAMQLWTVLGGIWIYMTSTGTGRKKVIINVWSQKSGNFLQTFDPDSYLIIAISKFVLHSGKKYKTLAKNKQNKNWQNYWWVRLWYFWQNEKKTADKMQIAITQSGWRPFWRGRGWLPQWPTPPTPPGLNLFFMYLKS